MRKDAKEEAKKYREKQQWMDDVESKLFTNRNEVDLALARISWYYEMWCDRLLILSYKRSGPVYRFPPLEPSDLFNRPGWSDRESWTPANSYLFRPKPHLFLKLSVGSITVYGVAAPLFHGEREPRFFINITKDAAGRHMNLIPYCAGGTWLHLDRDTFFNHFGEFCNHSPPKHDFQRWYDELSSERSKLFSNGTVNDSWYMFDMFDYRTYRDDFRFDDPFYGHLLSELTNQHTLSVSDQNYYPGNLSVTSKLVIHVISAIRFLLQSPIRLSDISCEWRVQTTRHLFSTSTNTHLTRWFHMFSCDSIDSLCEFPLAVQFIVWNYLDYP
jgi:hypothetical protein